MKNYRINHEDYLRQKTIVGKQVADADDMLYLLNKVRQDTGKSLGLHVESAIRRSKEYWFDLLRRR